MSLRIGADERLMDADEEEVWLPGPTADADEEGPFEFRYPRIGTLMKAGRRLQGVDLSTMEAKAAAAQAELHEQEKWLATGFGPEAWAHIIARRDADGDLLDDEHLAVLFRRLNEKHTGRPTTSSNGASRQPWKKPSTAAPSPQESDSVS
jgi:hypothetical protein